jgi:hypothetical protein
MLSFLRRHGFLHRPKKLHQGKRALIDHAFRTLGARTFADLGGVWGVEGGYTFYALEHHPVEAATLVDTHVTAEVAERATRHPQLRIVRGNFGSEAVAAQVGEVDAVFLFDVLLHQVRPDWDEVLALYASRARHLLIFNQQWVGPGSRVRLLDLGEPEYFRNVPHQRSEPTYAALFSKLDEIHPDYDRPWRDVHHIWQWGITDDDLIARAEALGFTLGRTENHGRFGHLKNFENHSFVFSR